MDYLVQIPNEQILNELNLPKGSMTYVDIENSVRISKMITEKHVCQRASGGSAANTMSGLAQLGVEAGFLSKVGKDEVGQFFEKQMSDTHVKPLMLKSDTPSGRVMAFVTPDGERTFATCLGAAIELGPDDIKPELFDGWDLFYVEGYLVANPDMLRKAIETAKAKGMKIAIDLASYNVVEESRDFLMELVENHVNIVFANEGEALALTGLDPEAALHFIAERCDIAVVKVGAKGAFVQRGAADASRCGRYHGRGRHVGRRILGRTRARQRPENLRHDGSHRGKEHHRGGRSQNGCRALGKSPCCHCSFVIIKPTKL